MSGAAAAATGAGVDGRGVLSGNVPTEAQNVENKRDLKRKERFKQPVISLQFNSLPR